MRFLVLLAVAAMAAADIALITDVHIGCHVSGEYKGEEGKDTRFLRRLVEKINSHPNVTLTFVLGDQSDKAQDAQWQKSIEILNGLQAPWLPVIGNHDIYYVSGIKREKPPTGDRRFGEHFGSLFEQLPAWAGKVIDYQGRTPVHNPEHNFTSYYQNFIVGVGRTIFLGLDWCSRGVGPVRAATDAQLHMFPGGTYEWLRQILGTEGDGTYKSVVILQHHPFQCPIEFYTCFTDSKITKVLSMIESKLPWKPQPGQQQTTLFPPLGAWWGVLAGHIHRRADVHPFDKRPGGPWAALREWETAASKDGPHLSLLTLDPDTGAVTSIVRDESD